MTVFLSQDAIGWPAMCDFGISLGILTYFDIFSCGLMLVSDDIV